MRAASCTKQIVNFDENAGLQSVINTINDKYLHQTVYSSTSLFIFCGLLPVVAYCLDIQEWLPYTLFW